MKAYVAGRSDDVETVREAQQIVRDAGGEITFDWTGKDGEIRPDVRSDDVVAEDRLVQEHPHPFDGYWETTLTHTPTGTTVHVAEPTKIRAHEAAMKELRKLLGGWADDPEEACRVAENERLGVKNADVLIAIYKDGRGLGKVIEIGMALMARKRVILVGPFAESVFWYMPRVERVADLEELRASL